MLSSRPQFLHLPLGRWVPAPKGLGHERQESQALPTARLLSPIKLPFVAVVQGEASLIGSSWHCDDLDGGGDFDVHGRVLAAGPVWHQNIGWAPVVTKILLCNFGSRAHK